MQVLKDDIRNDILKSALEEFSDNGYAKATMISIAKRSKVSKSNLYRYFASKEEICHELLKEPIISIQNALKVLTGTEFLSHSNDEIACMMTDALFPILSIYRREIMIIINADAPRECGELKAYIEKKLMKNFLAFDPQRTPKGFAETLVKMLMAGIENILMDYHSDENMKEQINSLFKYHIRGVLAFSMLREEK